MVRKDAVKLPEDIQGKAEASEPPAHAAAPVHVQQQAFPAVAPSTVVNIALHSLLMVTVPFALFFGAYLGAFDCECCVNAQAACSR